MPGRVTLDCPAKLNLALAVAPPDPQDPAGLHPITSWMVALDFHDTLTVEKIQAADSADVSSTASVFRLAYAPDAPRPGVIDWPLERDLVFRAHGLLEQHVGRALPVRVTLNKRIPTGAGLGGGSSDAAGMIVALDRLFDLQLDADALRRVAASLGSDVHFALSALHGDTSALVTGSGDRVESVPRSLAWPLHIVLVLPGFGCPTGPVYAAFDRLGSSRPAWSMSRWREWVRGYTPESGGLFNDLTAAAVDVEPRLGELLEALRQVSPHPVQVTGSGAACFVVVESSAQAQQLAQRVRQQLGVAALATRTLG